MVMIQNRQFYELSDQVSTSSHGNTAIVLVKDVVQTLLRLQLRLYTRFSLNIDLGFIWALRIISPNLAKNVGQLFVIKSGGAQNFLFSWLLFL